MICSSEKRFFTSNLLGIGNWTPNEGATQTWGDVAEALAGGKKSGGWTAAARLDAVVTTASLSEEEKNAWCRAQGLYPSELAHWREAATGALERPGAAVKTPSVAEGRRVRELERELRRKEKALAEAAALLVLSKKREAIFHKDADV